VSKSTGEMGTGNRVEEGGEVGQGWRGGCR